MMFYSGPRMSGLWECMGVVVCYMLTCTSCACQHNFVLVCFVGMSIYVCVCMCVCVCVCASVCEVLCRLPGVNGCDLSTRSLSEKRMHNRSNETLEVVASPFIILCSCHLLFLNVADSAWTTTKILKNQLLCNGQNNELSELSKIIWMDEILITLSTEFSFGLNLIIVISASLLLPSATASRIEHQLLS